MCKAIQYIFKKRKKEGGLNATFLCLIPNVPNPKSTSVFRPIACVNTLYKAVAKIIANRLKLPILVSENQITFLPGRKI